MRVGAQGIGQYEGVAAVILGTGRRVAIAKAVQLLWVDGEYGETMFEESFHDGAVWDLDGRS